MADEFYGFEEEELEEKGRDNLFLWTIFILLLIGVAFTCWLGSFYIFGHPEIPWCYKLLKKLGKIEAPKRFEIIAAPPGEFQNPQKLFEKYSKYTRLELEQENGELIRNYIKNFHETKKLTPYIAGRFSIINSYELKPSDMFASGAVALAQSIDFPQVLIEHVYPTAKDNVSQLRTMLQTGLDMKIERTNDLSALIHIEKIYDGRLQFTLVPLLYGTYALKQGVGTFSLEPPADLNMEGGVPVIKDQLLKSALTEYINYRRTRPLADNGPDAPAVRAGPELVRVDTVEPGAKVPETGAMPAVPIATPVPIPGKPTPRLVAIATPTPRINVAMLNTPPLRPVTTPAPIAPAPIIASPTPAPMVVPHVGLVPPASTPRVSSSGVPLQPFIVAAPAPGTLPPVPGATWRTFAPGQAPPARSITPTEATSLADRGDLGERLYLRGDFRVTASGENRAVLRDRAAGADPANPSPVDGVRIIAEYPAGAVPPDESAVIARDSSRPFEIRDIRKGADGQINIYVREITAQP
ncbi:MAG: hypothetical protein QOE70_5221 [Chthoniobacter sp.]|jgi:hypothetical protein|nr:hypothetical protein [Chthoniobacter sp.]